MTTLRPNTNDIHAVIRQLDLPLETVQVPGHRQYVVTPDGMFIKIWGWRTGKRVVDHKGRVQFSTSDIIVDGVVVRDKKKRVSRSASKIVFECFVDRSLVNETFVQEFIKATI